MNLEQHDRYDFVPLTSRQDYTWPDGKRLAVCFCNNIEVFSFLSGLGSDSTLPNPPQSTRNYAWRDYGNRVGQWYLFDLFDEMEVPASHNLNSLLFEACPEIVERIQRRGDEVGAMARAVQVFKDALIAKRAADAAAVATIVKTRAAIVWKIMINLLISLFADCRAEPIRCAGRACNTNSRRLVDATKDGWRRSAQRRLADALRPPGPGGLGLLDDIRLDRWHVPDGGDQVIVQIFGFAGDIFFHEGQAEPLRDATMNLPFDLLRIERAPHVMGGGDAGDLNRAQIQIDLHVGDLCGKPVGSVWFSLATFVKRLGGGIEIPFADQDVAAVQFWQGIQVNFTNVTTVGGNDTAVADL